MDVELDVIVGNNSSEAEEKKRKNALEDQVWTDHQREQSQDAELERLEAELAEAQLAYKQVLADAADRSWGSWLKYALYTPSSKASNAEIISFIGSRVALLNGLSNLGFAVAYLLPGITATNVYKQDLATDSATTQTDFANYEYYWSNVVAYGFQALTSFGAALMSLSYSYKGMRERIEETKKADVKLAQEKLAAHKLSVEKAAEMRLQRDGIKELLHLARATAERQARELKASQLTVEKLARDLTEAREANNTSAEREGGLRHKLEETTKQLEKAKQDVEAKTRLSQEQARKLEELTSELELARGLAKQHEVESQILETQLNEAKVRQEILQSVASRLETVCEKLESAQSQAKGLENSVTTTNNALETSTEKK